RPDRAGTPAGLVPRVAEGGSEDRRVRHARHRRGDQDRRPHRHSPNGRTSRAVRHAARHSRAAGGRVRRRVRRSRPRAEGARAADARRPRARAAGRRAALRPLVDRARRTRARAREARRASRRHRRERRRRRLDHEGRAPFVIVAGGPVIPNFGTGSSCEVNNGWFCPDWVHEHWGDTLQPALVQHVELTAIAVVVGFALAFGLALAGFRYRLLDPPIGFLSDFLYTIPSLALFQLLLPITGISVTTVEIAL